MRGRGGGERGGGGEQTDRPTDKQIDRLRYEDKLGEIIQKIPFG